MEKLLTLPQALLKKRNGSFAFCNSYLSYFLMYNFYYLSWALFSALISVYLLDQGYSAGQVSLVVSASFLSSMAAQPLIGSLSDRYDPKKINMILFVLTSLGSIFFLFARNLITILIGYSFVMTLMNGTNPVMEKIATASPFQYGKIRVWGTVGYALGSQLAGLLYDYVSPRSLFAVFVGTILLCLLGLWGTHPDLKKDRKASDQTVRPSDAPKTSLLTLLKNRKYMIFLLISAVFCGVTNAINTFLPALLQAKDMEISTAAAFLSIAVLSEVPLVLLSSKYMDRLSNKTLILIAVGLCMAESFVFAVIPGVPAALGITMLAKHPATMLFIMINLKAVSTIVSPAQQITALAFVQTFRSLMSILFQNLGGIMVDAFSYESFFLVCFIVMTLVMVLTLFYKIEKGPKEKLFS